MSISIYNPKFLTVNGRKTLNTTDVKNFIWSHGKWFLKAGEMKKFSDDVGGALLRHIEFLVEVTAKNYEQIKKEVEEKAFKCDKCAFETGTKIAYFGHYQTHEKEEKVDLDIPEAEAKEEFFGTGKRVVQNPEGNIPQGGTKRNPVEDKDGVGWYGEGFEKDN